MATLKFVLLFTLLTAAYLAIGRYIFIPLVAKVRGKAVKEYVRNENTWFWVLAGATLVTLVIACFNWGPGILLPKEVPTPEQRGTVSDFFNHLLHGKNAPAKSVPKEPLPWGQGTWFWWKAFFLYLPFTILYGCWAFSDEIIEFAKKQREKKREREKKEMEERVKKGDHDGKKKGKDHTHTTSHDSVSHFWKPNAWNIISILEMLARLFKKK